MPNNITIDTNVFVHLFNPFQNRNGHIDDLLQGLVRQSRVTCYDVGEGKPDRIESEYLHQLGPIIKSGKTERIRIELFRYFCHLEKVLRAVELRLHARSSDSQGDDSGRR